MFDYKYGKTSFDKFIPEHSIGKVLEKQILKEKGKYYLSSNTDQLFERWKIEVWSPAKYTKEEIFNEGGELIDIKFHLVEKEKSLNIIDECWTNCWDTIIKQVIKKNNKVIFEQ